MNQWKEKEKIQKYMDILSVFLIIIGVHMVIGFFNGKWPWSHNHYNSYLLQVLAWMDGSLHLPGNIEYLELAVYEGNYYVSFPPFPSYVLLPFALLFKERTPEGWISFFILLTGAFYALRIAWHFVKPGMKAVFWTAFVYIGTNVLYVTLDAQVWFFAQNLALTLSFMAIYYAMKGKGGASLFFWGCSVGCRPMQIVYFPILVYLLYQYLKKEDINRTFLSMLKEKYFWAIPVTLIALSYMALNFARFGNPIEFGHNYLPEFTREEFGQFHPSYILRNVKSLFRFPTKGDYDTYNFYKFDGNCIFLVIPMFVSYLIYILRKFIQKQKIDLMYMTVLPLLIISHILMLCSHRTMGGFHFGHRYINDTLPYVYLGILLFAGTNAHYKNVTPAQEAAAEEENHTAALQEVTKNYEIESTDMLLSEAESEENKKVPAAIREISEEPLWDFTYCLHYPLCFLGLAVNIVGTIALNMGWI